MSNSAQILVIDESPVLRDVLRKLLETNGYEVVTSGSAKEALEELQTRHFDLVVGAVDMPDMSGLELLERVKNTVDAQIPVIFTAGTINTEYAMQAFRQGAADFMLKPLDNSKVLRAVTTHLAKKRHDDPVSKSISFISQFDLMYEFKPTDFIAGNLASLAMNHLGLIKEIPASVFNALIIAVDEMLNNAFLHGVFRLDKTKRELPHAEYTRTLGSLAQLPGISGQTVNLRVFVDRGNKKIVCTVNDKGPGFDWELHLRAEKEHLLNLAGTGRGLHLLKMLSDEIYFDNAGRNLTIVKYYHSA